MDSSGSTHEDKVSGRLVSQLLNVWQPFVDADAEI